MTIKSITINQSAKLIHIAAVRNYVVSVIDHGGSTFDKIKFFFETFESEYGHEVKRTGLQKALQSYLQGLPSTINHEFSNYGILKLLVDWEYLTQSEVDNYDRATVAKQAKVDNELDNYWKALAMALITVAKRNKVLS